MGGRVIFGGQAIGFRPMQVWLGSDDGDGMPVELLEPWEVEQQRLPRSLPRTPRCRSASHDVQGPRPARRDRTHAQRRLSSRADRSQRSGVERSISHAARSARHGGAARRDARPSRDARRAPRPRRASTDRTCIRSGGSIPSPRPDRVARCVESCCVHPRSPVPSASSPGLLQGNVERETATSADVVWPGGSRVRLEARNDVPPGIDRLEVEGFDGEVTLAGTRFCGV